MLKTLPTTKTIWTLLLFSSLLHPSEKRHVTWLATLDGALGSFLPLSEKRYRRLFMLHNKLVTAVPHVAGLNPKKFR